MAWLLLVCATVVPEGASAEPIKIHNQQVLLNVDDPSVTRIGRLRYRGGVSLSSDDPRFGGLSGLLVDRGGQRLKAVSDKGTWLIARIKHDSKRRLIGLDNAEIAGMRDRAGEIVKGKKFGDAEAMARVNGHVIVAYEHTHRLWHYADRGNFLNARPKIERRPPRGRKHSRVLRRNHGIEALTELSGNRLFALPEGRKDAVVRQPGWIIDGKRWHPVSYARKGLYRPVGAATLPNGDVLVLERRLTLIGGLSSRLVRVSARSIRAGAVIKGKEIAVLQSPMIADNFEGISARRGPDGKTLVYLVSDDNFNILQRTLLLMFELDESG